MLGLQPKQLNKGTNPLPGGDVGGDNEVDVKSYVTWQVSETGHLFTAPLDKYKGIADVLGLKNVDNDDEARAVGKRLKRGEGYTYLGIVVKGGGTLKVVCAIGKISSALVNLVGKTVYNAKIRKTYLPQTRH